jgi:hypothetical protein
MHLDTFIMAVVRALRPLALLATHREVAVDNMVAQAQLVAQLVAQARHGCSWSGLRQAKQSSQPSCADAWFEASWPPSVVLPAAVVVLR